MIYYLPDKYSTNKSALIITYKMSLSIYIPRILGSMNKTMIYDAFKRMEIGSVTDLDIVYKINENNNAYYFAFIKINPYNTPQSTELQHELNEKNQSHLVYDEEAGQYWVINKCIPLDQRNQNTPTPTYKYPNSGLITSIWTPIESIINLTKENLPQLSAFTEKDKMDLVEEFEELEREIRFETSYV
jgi:hypothetical protein